MADKPIPTAESIAELAELVIRYDAYADYYTSPSENYNKHSCRDEFINELLGILGWDVGNVKGVAPQYREVIAENYSSNTERPDYTMTVSGQPCFFVEAKKPSVNIIHEVEPALQARKYGWNARHNISVLANFEDLIVYDARVMPKAGDAPSTARYRRYNHSEYVECFDEIYTLLSRESVFGRYYYEFVESEFPHTWKQNRSQGKRARLLALEDGQCKRMTKIQRAYIDEGENCGENNGYKCSTRDSWYSVPSIWIPDAFFLRRNNLYPKLVLNRCGAISTDTMHRMKFRDGTDPELAIIAYYNSIAFAFTELCGRSYGGGVLEILPKEVGNIHVLNTGLLNINAGLKRNVISVIDRVVRNGRNIDEALDYVDAKILVGILRFDEDTCRASRRIWKTLQARRLGRGKR